MLARANALYEAGGDGVRDGLALFDLERANIDAGFALAAGAAADDDALARLCSGYCGAGAYVLDLRQHPRRRIDWLQAARAAARRLGDRQMEGNHTGTLGLAHAALGEVRRAIEFYEQVLTIVRELGDRRGEGSALFNMALAFEDLGERDKALAHMDEARRICEEIEAPLAQRAAAQLAEWRSPA